MRVQDTLYFPVVTADWSANEELLLLEGIEMHGLGNWIDVSNHISTKTAAECEKHYFGVYIDVPSQPLPELGQWSEQELESLTLENTKRIRAMGKIKHPPFPKVQPSVPINPELSGYMEKRHEFETEVRRCSGE